MTLPPPEVTSGETASGTSAATLVAALYLLFLGALLAFCPRLREELQANLTQPFVIAGLLQPPAPDRLAVARLEQRRKQRQRRLQDLTD